MLQEMSSLLTLCMRVGPEKSAVTIRYRFSRRRGKGGGGGLQKRQKGTKVAA